MQRAVSICRHTLARLATVCLCLLLALPAVAQEKSPDTNTTIKPPAARPRPPQTNPPTRPPAVDFPRGPATPDGAGRAPVTTPPAKPESPPRPPSTDAPRRPPAGEPSRRALAGAPARPADAERPSRGPDTDAPPKGSVADEVRRPPPAEEPRQSAGRAEIQVLVILATNENNRIDPALRNLAEQFRPTFKFSGYQLVRKDSRPVELGVSTTFPLAGSYALQITPTAITGNKVVMNVLTLRGVGQTRGIGLQMRATPGKYQLLGGWPVAHGTLLAAVTARPMD